MNSRLSHITVLGFLLGGLAFGQTADSGAAASTLPCNPWKIQLFTSNLNFGQRSCLAYSQLLGPGFALQAVTLAGVSQWRNSPHINRADSDEFALRIEHLYARRAARSTGELLVSAWHREDPRFRPSSEQGGWLRTRSAFLNVLASPDPANGNMRMAFAPLAGSLSSGFTTMGFRERHATVGYALERSAIVYGHYFARALYHEFSPELWAATPHFLRKHHAPSVPVD